jgi:hypothetical protein
MNPSPYVVTQTSLLSRIFRLFRTMGLRHLCIVNHHHQVSLPLPRWQSVELGLFVAIFPFFIESDTVSPVFQTTPRF